MAPPLQMPLINGIAHSHSSVEIKYGPNIYTGVKSLRYSHKVEPGGGHGTRQVQIISTGGLYTATGEIELYLYEAARLINDLGNGFMNKFVTMTASWQARGLPMVVDRLLNVRLIESGVESSEGGDPTTRKYGLYVGALLENGKRPINNMGY